MFLELHGVNIIVENIDLIVYFGHVFEELGASLNDVVREGVFLAIDVHEGLRVLGGIKDVRQIIELSCRLEQVFVRARERISV